MCLGALGGKMPAIRNTPLIKVRRIRRLASLLPRLRPLNSRRPIWISQPLFSPPSPGQAVSISIRTRSTTSGSPRISHGTSRFTEAGTVVLQQHSPKATTEPAQDLVGASAIDKSAGNVGLASLILMNIRGATGGSLALSVTLCFLSFQVISRRTTNYIDEAANPDLSDVFVDLLRYKRFSRLDCYFCQ